MSFFRHMGKRKVTVQFRITVRCAERISGFGEGQAFSCQCKRGGKQYSTKVALLENGSVQWDEALSFGATLYADKKPAGASTNSANSTSNTSTSSRPGTLRSQTTSALLTSVFDRKDYIFLLRTDKGDTKLQVKINLGDFVKEDGEREVTKFFNLSGSSSDDGKSPALKLTIRSMDAVWATLKKPLPNEIVQQDNSDGEEEVREQNNADSDNEDHTDEKDANNSAAAKGAPLPPRTNKNIYNTATLNSSNFKNNGVNPNNHNHTRSQSAVVEEPSSKATSLKPGGSVKIEKQSEDNDMSTSVKNKLHNFGLKAKANLEARKRGDSTMVDEKKQEAPTEAKSRHSRSASDAFDRVVAEEIQKEEKDRSEKDNKEKNKSPNKEETETKKSDARARRNRQSVEDILEEDQDEDNKQRKDKKDTREKDRRKKPSADTVFSLDLNAKSVGSDDEGSGTDFSPKGGADDHLSNIYVNGKDSIRKKPPVARTKRGFSRFENTGQRSMLDSIDAALGSKVSQRERTDTLGIPAIVDRRLSDCE